MAQCAAHGHHLAFVVKRMCQEMVEDERRGADRAVSIRETQFRIGVEALVGQPRQILHGLSRDFPLQESGVRDCGALGWTLVRVREPLERVNPESFAVQYVEHLLAKCRRAEASHLSPIIACGDSGKVIEHDIEAGVSPAVQFPNTFKGEHKVILDLIRDLNRSVHTKTRLKVRVVGHPSLSVSSPLGRPSGDWDRKGSIGGHTGLTSGSLPRSLRIVATQGR